jgi:hypothetical protein
LRKNGVEDRVRDLVGDLVGVAFGDGFRGEEEVLRHEKSSLVVVDFGVADPSTLEPGERFSRIYESPCK